MTAQTQTIDQPETRSLTEIRRQPLVTQDATLLMDTAKFEQIQRVAAMMAQMKLMPEHLRGSPADCAMVVEQAWRWQMSPTAVGSKTYSVGGKLAYEGQLVAAVVNTRAGLKGRLNYRYEGEFDRAKQQDSTLEVTVYGTLEGEDEPREATVKWVDGFAMSKGAKDKWLSQPQQQLAYFAARVWARRHTPDVLMGVYTREELEAEAVRIGPDHARDITPARPRRSDFQAEHPGLTPTADEVPADEPDETFDLYDEVGEVRGPYGPGMWLSSLRDLLYRGNRPTPACRQIVESNLETARAIIASGRVDGATWEGFEVEMVAGGYMDDPEKPQAVAEDASQQTSTEAAETQQDDPSTSSGAAEQQAEPVTYPYRHSSGQLIVDCQTAQQFVNSLEQGMVAGETEKNAALWRANRSTVMQIVEEAGDEAERLMGIQSRFVHVKPAAARKGK